MDLAEKTLAIVGLGYVGLPLALEFGKYRSTIGFDISDQRINELQSGIDKTLECDSAMVERAQYLRFTSTPRELELAQVYVVTVPTPVDETFRPDFAPLIDASVTLGSVLKPGDVVIFESTVYPGATEEICVPVLERESGLVFNQDFFCGYSPERINPGDKGHRLPDIVKITSGSTPEVATAVDRLYSEIVAAGTHKASSIRVAEAAKVIENIQRDVNIALMNELSLIFGKLDIDTSEVLQAAATKWNFVSYHPGLVGGHCIGVDPYYLTHKALEVGYRPEIILAGRRINDGMAAHVASETVMLMLRKGMPVLKSKILVLGLTFKENCPDLRNTKVVDLVRHLQSYNTEVDVYDPWVHKQVSIDGCSLHCLERLPASGDYSAIVLAVAHDQFIALGEKGLRALGRAGSVLYDVKSVLDKGASDGRL